MNSRNPETGFTDAPPPGARVCAAHQPNLLPWAGYFAKMHQADVFIIADTVQYVKQQFISRCRLADRNGPLWLSIPVCRSGHYGQTVREVRIDYSTSWEKKFSRTIEHRYGKTPLFNSLGEAVLRNIRRKFDRLLDLNVALIRLLNETMGIRTPLVLLSETGSTTGDRCGRLVEMTKAVECTHYLSGKGASLTYLTDTPFKAADITCSFFSFMEEPYLQPSPEFIPGCSIIDALFRLGIDETRLRIGIR